MPELSLAPIDRLMRTVGAERISDEAISILREILEEMAKDISRQAMELAKHAGRKTILADDVKLAAKYVLRRSWEGLP